MPFDEYLAIRFTPVYARAVGWPVDADKVCDVLGLNDPSLTAKDFVWAVRRWQQSNPPLRADGLLGPETWARMAPVVRSGRATKVFARFARNGFLSALGARKRSTPGGAKASPPARSPAAAPVPISLDDKLLAQMAYEAVNNTDVHVAYPVSAAEVAWNAHMTMPHMVPPLLVVPTLTIGQKWPAAKGGYRIVLALAPPNVYFMTETGRTYSENLLGWEDDYVALIYSSVAESLGPLETMLEVEADFLLGACSATGFGGVVIVVGGSAVQWVLKNKDNLSKWIAAISTLLDVRKSLKTLAPTFYDDVFYALLKSILAEVPESLMSSPKILAKLIGQMLVAIGKLALERDPSAAIGVIKPIMKELVRALKAGLEYGLIAAAKAIPGAVKAAAQNSMQVMEDGLIADLGKQGVNLTQQQADAIMMEITSHPKEILKVFQDFESAFKDLTVD